MSRSASSPLVFTFFPLPVIGLSVLCHLYFKRVRVPMSERFSFPFPSQPPSPPLSFVAHAFLVAKNALNIRFVTFLRTVPLIGTSLLFPFPSTGSRHVELWLHVPFPHGRKTLLFFSKLPQPLSPYSVVFSINPLAFIPAFIFFWC